MQKSLAKKINGAFLSFLSLSLLSGCVFGYEDKVSYLDSVTNSYLYGQTSTESNLLNINSPDARGV